MHTIANASTPKRSLPRHAANALALIAGTALCLSVTAPAIADEPDVKVESRSSQIFMLNENGRKVEVRIEDGKLATATLDGKALPTDRVRIEKDRVVITNPDGTTLAQIDIPEAAEMKLERREGNQGAIRIGPEQRPLRRRLVAPNDDAQRERLAQPEVAREVMLGLRQAPVPGVLARHLGLERGVGSLVAGVAKAMPAAVAGLKPYDIVVSFNDEPVTSTDAIVQFLSDKNIKPGQLVKLGVMQQGVRKEITISPIQFNADDMEKAEWDEADSADIDTFGLASNLFQREGQAPGNEVIIRPLDIDPLHQRNMGEDMRAQIERLMRQQRAVERLELPQPRERDNAAENQALRDRLDRMEQQLQRLIEQTSKKP